MSAHGQKVAVLVTGGAGYIGSHTCKALARAGLLPVTYDSLVNGHCEAVQWGPFEQGDIADRERLDAVIRKHSIQAVVHFAAYAYVGESMRVPGKYFQNNVANTLNLLDVMCMHGIKPFVFSSTCAIYGVPEKLPIDESSPRCPANPYGESKLFIERALSWYGAAHGIRPACLRYFNAAGADPDGELGEEHEPETHLVPLVIQTAMGQRPAVDIFGTDYATPDGTAIRDYIHVTDLADAHVLALKRMFDGAEDLRLNLGTGRGHSVLEIVDAVSRTSGVDIETRACPKRPGDPAELVADPTLARRVLGWEPAWSSLDQIIDTAWRWHDRRICSTGRRAAASATQPPWPGTTAVGTAQGP